MALEIKNVSRTFEGSMKETLKDISLSVEQGEFICVVGPSGCGKSTLLNIIAGLDFPTDGEIFLDEKKITAPGADRVVMFQEHALFPWLNVMENVKFGMKMMGVPKEEQNRRAEHYLKMVQLWEFREYSVHEISGGMRQRTALARSLCLDGPVLLMDEPFSALDKQTSNRLRSELQDMWLRTRQTILFITHSVEEAVYLADRIVIMSPSAHSIANIVPVELERPRHVYDAEFVEYRRKILKEVEGNQEK